MRTRTVHEATGRDGRVFRVGDRIDPDYGHGPCPMSRAIVRQIWLDLDTNVVLCNTEHLGSLGSPDADTTIRADNCWLVE